MYSIDDVSVNGYMMDPFWGTEVVADSVAFSDISWFDESLEENGIDKNDITEIEFTLRASDSDDWMADPYVEENIVLNF